MSKIVKNQHYIPRMVIKRWCNEDNFYKVYELNKKIFYKFNLKNYSSDGNPFTENFFYESNRYKTNYIEKSLSKIEDKFSKVVDKIVKSNNNISLNRKELKVIKSWIIIDGYRQKSFLDKAKRLDGDHKFNSIFLNKSDKDIKNIQLEILNTLLTDVYEYSQKNVNFLNERLQKMLSNWEKNIKSNDYSLDKIEDVILSQILNSYSNSFIKIVKISDYLKSSFLFSDCTSVQFFGEGNSKIFSIPIINILPISTKFAIAQIYLDYQDIFKENISRWIKGSFWEKILTEDFFEKNHNINYNKAHLFKYRPCLDISKYYSNDDIFLYKTFCLSNDEQVEIINGMMLSQTNNYIFYKKGYDIFNAQKKINEYNIYRVEEINR